MYRERLAAHAHHTKHTLYETTARPMSQQLYLQRKQPKEEWDPCAWEVPLQPLPKRSLGSLLPPSSWGDGLPHYTGTKYGRCTVTIVTVGTLSRRRGGIEFQRQRHSSKNKHNAYLRTKRLQSTPLLQRGDEHTYEVECASRRKRSETNVRGIHHPNSRGHTKAWESITPTQGTTPKCGSPSPQLKGTHQSVGVGGGVSRAASGCPPWFVMLVIATPKSKEAIWEPNVLVKFIERMGSRLWPPWDVGGRNWGFVNDICILRQLLSISKGVDSPTQKRPKCLEDPDHIWSQLGDTSWGFSAPFL